MYKVEVIADNSGQWCGNSLTFETREKAEEYARDLFSRWTAVREWRIVDLVADAADGDPGELNEPVRELWCFDLDPGETCYTAIKPPAWSDNMRNARRVVAPAMVALEFEPDAMEKFQREYGAPLHSVILYSDGSIKRNARVA